MQQELPSLALDTMVLRSQSLSSQGAYPLEIKSILDMRPAMKGSGYTRLEVLREGLPFGQSKKLGQYKSIH